LQLIGCMYDSQVGMPDSSVTMDPVSAARFHSGERIKELDLFNAVCGSLFPRGVGNLEQLTRGLMAALCSFRRLRLQRGGSQKQSPADLWAGINLGRWDEKRLETSQLLHDDCCVAII